MNYPALNPAVAFLIFLCYLCLGSTCFITNCPIGGKRSMNPREPGNAVRQCMPCGPGGLGQCYGPNICCGETIGCFVRTAETRSCRHEDDVPVPCDVRGKPCGQDGAGRCGSNEICCNEDSCHVSSECAAKSETEKQESLDRAFIAVLKNLIHKNRQTSLPRK